MKISRKEHRFVHRIYIFGGTMATRKNLAEITKIEAQKFFHGTVMQTEPTIQPIISFFPIMVYRRS